METKILEVEEEVELPPDRQSAIKILEFLRPEKYSRRKPLDAAPDSTPEEEAGALGEALTQMGATLPLAPASREDILEEVRSMSDDEVAEALAQLGED